MKAAALLIQDLKVGLTAELTWFVTAEQIDSFAALSGDHNPLHVDAAFARGHGYPDRVAHGMLLASKLSAFVGMLMPGRDCLLLETQLAWTNVVHPSDVVVIRGEIVELSAELRVLKIKFIATKKCGERNIIVGRGSALCQIQY